MRKSRADLKEEIKHLKKLIRDCREFHKGNKWNISYCDLTFRKRQVGPMFTLEVDPLGNRVCTNIDLQGYTIKPNGWLPGEDLDSDLEPNS